LLLLLLSCEDSKDTEDSEEQNDDINIDDQSTNDVVVQGDLELVIATNDELGVVDKIEGIDADDEDRVDEVHHLASEEDTVDTSNEGTDSESEQHATKVGEISLGCAGVGSQSNCDGSCECESHEDEVCWVETADNGYEVTFSDSEDTEGNVIGWDGACDFTIANDHVFSDNHGDDSEDKEPCLGSLEV